MDEPLISFNNGHMMYSTIIPLLPDWYEKSDYLMFYRICGEKWRYYFFSLFKFNHNEIMNCWTHIIGFLSAFGFLFIKYNDFLMYLFLVCSMIGFGCSAIMHTFHPMNEKVYLRTLALDYCGINISFFGLMYPFVSFAFYNQSQVIYSGMLCIATFLGCVLSIINIYRTKKRYLKIIAFSLPLLSGFIPIIHKAIIGTNEIHYITSSHYLINISILFVLGSFFYFSQITERFFAYRNLPLEMFCQSHVIYHFISLITFYYAYYGIYITETKI